ncbi:hypothetical protein CQW23_13939 [Capsicum baccatum]|uniref:CCHC-type domain-containing protein n=1 Tax=Capsicum baccatum TaxID=33114 RepID=A0A2G2WHS2_CAPBA|nr:hypothetical protein CQW23_13939 [Capsicum baccatum]
MPTRYSKPRLLLIQGALGLSSSELSAFNSLLQESNRVKSIIHMVEMYEPDVVLVEKSVYRDIQEYALLKGLTLVLDIKQHRLERVAQYTGSPIISSELLESQKLKQCDSFHFEKFLEEHTSSGDSGKTPSKTLMFIRDGSNRLGCTELQVIIHDLLSEGLIVNDAFQVAMTIEKLPPMWKDFKNYSKQKLKEMTVEDLIKAAERRSKGNSTINEAQIIENDQNNSKKRKKVEQGSNQPKKKFKGKCFNCGKIGHESTDCRAPKKGKKKDQANMIEFNKECDDLCVMFSECNLVGNPREWWMDFGATRYVCANKELFSPFAPALVEKMIYMANSAKAKVEGTGKVGLKMTSGKVLALNNVLFKINECDKCVYIKDTLNHQAIVCLYVDDMLIISREISDINVRKRMLESKFDMKDLGVADVILGIRIHRNPQRLTLSQSHYIKNLLDKFKYMEFGIAKTLLDVSFVLQNNEVESEFIVLEKTGEEVEWLQNFLEDISYWPKPVAPVYIHCDSQATISRAGSMMYNGKSRHIRRRHNTVRELLSSGIITVDHVKSKDNVLDPLTKGLSREGVERTSKGMGLRPRISQHDGNST